MADTAQRLAVVWEGAQRVGHSLARVNRELCARLDARGHRLSLRPSEPARFAAAGDARLERLAALENRPLEPQVTVRHQWPPRFEPPSAGRLALMQPWEFGSLPAAWLAPMNTVVDEVWVYTEWLRGCYERSGVDPARLRVVPLGVDVARYHPGAAPHPLASERRFRFLFVGGTIHRKGIDVLLRAYLSAFRADDDVCLVVKDHGAGSFYAGQTQHELIAQARQAPGAPEILYLDEELDEAAMPGLYTACDVLVQPYRGEGFGLPIAEAMACARLVIVTGYGAALDFCDASCARLVPARERRLAEARIGERATVELPWLAEPDERALAGELRRAFEQREAGRQLGHHARERIRTRFSWEHAADACEAGLRALAEARPASREARAGTSRAGRAREVPAESDAPPLHFLAAPFDYSGYARVARALLPALDAAGVPVGLQALGSAPYLAELEARPKEAALWSRLLHRQGPGGVACCFLPPVSWEGRNLWQDFRRQNPGRAAYAGITMFETDRLPEGWAEACDAVDEVWVPSRFNLESFARGGVPEAKLRRLPLWIDLAPFAKPATPRALPGRRGFTFLSVFQWTRRKGWDVLLAAWAQAFTAADDVCLVLRSYPGRRREPPIRERVDAYLREIGHPPERCAPVVVLDAFVPDAEMPGLYAAADAFVLPSRGEAWGLPYLEALASGLPTLAPAWGGPLDFLHEKNARLIECEGSEPVHAEQIEDDPFYAGGQRWARPSVTHTAERMREVYERPEAARALGEAARAELLAGPGPETSAAALTGLARDLLGRRAACAPLRAEGPALPLVVWSGPLEDPSGYADEGRELVLGLDALGASVRCQPVAWSRRRAELEPRVAERLRALRETPVLGAAIHVQHVFARDFAPSPSALATVGRSMFETDGLPPGWAARCNALDEIWVPSAFNVESFARAGVAREKLHAIPSPLDAARFDAACEPLTLADARGFNFLSVFDWSLRKGWDVLLRAWSQAFDASDDVCLFLKVSSSHGLDERAMQAQIRRLLRSRLGRAAERVAPVVLLTAPLPSAQMPRLYRAADAFVLPSRGEGWGRPYAEAMACGVPVIATGWGGQTAYLHEENAWLVASKLAPVPRAALAEAPLFEGQHWAEPSWRHLAERLRQVRAEPARARARAERGRREVLAALDREPVARQVRARLQALAARRRARASIHH